jgi:hypothetical protein
VAEDLLCRGASLQGPAPNARRLWFKPREPDQGGPLWAVWANGSTVPLPNDKVGRLVADRFAPVTNVEPSDSPVELYSPVVDHQSGDGRRQARVDVRSKLRYTRGSPRLRQ